MKLFVQTWNLDGERDLDLCIPFEPKLPVRVRHLRDTTDPAGGPLVEIDHNGTRAAFPSLCFFLLEEEADMPLRDPTDDRTPTQLLADRLGLPRVSR